MSAVAQPAVAARPSAAAELEAYVARYRWLILLGLITAAIMEVLDTTIINVALPQMAGNLGATQEEIGWVSTGYILSNVVFLPMTAFFAERFGRQRYLTFSIILFIVSSFFCGTSHSLIELVFWRVLQGAGGAALLSTAQATIRQIFPREQQGMVQAIFLLGIIVAPTLGPTLGGWITDNYQWHWCFFINIPIGIAATFLVSTFLKDPPGSTRRARPVDWLGHLAARRGPGRAAVRAGGGQFEGLVRRAPSSCGSPSWRRSAWSACSGGSLRRGTSIPVVNFRVLHNRDLAASIFLFVALGFGAVRRHVHLPALHPESCASRPPRPAWRCCRAVWPPRARRSSAARCSTGPGPRPTPASSSGSGSPAALGHVGPGAPERGRG